VTDARGTDPDQLAAVIVVALVTAAVAIGVLVA